MGSSGMKRKGRKHLPKVGTPAGARATRSRTERRAWPANFGVQGKGWVFWTALVHDLRPRHRAAS